MSCFCCQILVHLHLTFNAQVKDKFDEIFASVKYKDCLKKLKDIRKKHMDDQRVDKSTLGFLKENKQKLKETQKELKRKEQEETNIKGQIEEKMADLEPTIKVICPKINRP